ncbi:acyltransferase family protein [Cellulomonas sp. HZM]|uniref:acyltransferase family protein n=1 Tax=Cellulomonas sp. HZM TaxID=1454010 RepID=UPI00068D33DB|nr:acyltransferase family protein [Cellulomonas sp. HZM]
MSSTRPSVAEDVPPEVAVPPAERRPSGTKVRVEVQALRAVAVMLVVLYHLWPKRLTGGYVGVDVFFVISGFLITGHLLREGERTGRVALGRFWARRARRLLPASLLVLVVTAVATFAWVPSGLWKDYLRQVGAAGFYVLNWVLAHDAVDYLAADAAPSPVQHYWSLSVEEQFYLVWPLLVLLALWVAARTGRRNGTVAAALLGVVTVVSFGWSLHLTTTDAPQAYFVTTARAWQFGAGALLALAMVAFEERAQRFDRARAVLSWAGLGALAWTGVSFTSATPFPGTAALVPVLGTAAVIAAGAPRAAWAPTRALALRPVQTLGDISYSTYLWHWPPIVILPFALGHELHAVDKLLLLAAVVVLAWATKRWVEDPVRSTHRFGLRRSGVTFALTAAGMCVVAAVCVVGSNAAGAASARAAAHAESVVASKPHCFGAASMVNDGKGCPDPALAHVVVPDPSDVKNDDAGLQQCWSDNSEPDMEPCTFGKPRAGVPHIALVGDSHARAMLPAFERLVDDGDVVVTSYLKASCVWSTVLPRRSVPSVAQGCGTWQQEVGADLLAKAHDYDAVVVTGYARQKMQVPAGANKRDVVASGLLDAWQPVLDAGTPVVAILDNPTSHTDPNECLLKEGRADPSRCDQRRADVLVKHDPLRDATDRSQGRVPLVELTDLYCKGSTCPAVIGGADVHRDDDHISSTYARSVAPYLWERLEPYVGR